MSLKAKLSIVLKADDVVVAESQDAKLWLKMVTSFIEESAAVAEKPNNSAHDQRQNDQRENDQHQHDQHAHGISA